MTPEQNKELKRLAYDLEVATFEGYAEADKARKQLRDYIDSLTLPPAQTFQGRVAPWMQACFGPEISSDKTERNHRFLEEALELVQSTGCTQGEVHQLVDYVYGREIGDPPQEVGGVMVTLAALCLAHGMDMHAAGEVELARIWTKVEQIRAKQAAKSRNSPLPVHQQPPAQPCAAAHVCDCQEAGQQCAKAQPQAELDAALWKRSTPPANISMKLDEWQALSEDARRGILTMLTAVHSPEPLDVRDVVIDQQKRRIAALRSELEQMRQRKDGAYLERNRCVALIAQMALALGLKAGKTRTAIEGWSDDWHGCVYIDLPVGQVSWHFHDSQAYLFDFLPAYDGKWDGHDTDEKYRRVGMQFESALRSELDAARKDAERIGVSTFLGKYGNVLAPFVGFMEQELHANSGKGDRPGWLAMSKGEALLEIYYHLAKLQKAVKDNDPARIQELSADVANMSMMLLDICGGIDAATHSEG